MGYNPECPECEKEMESKGRTKKKGGGDRFYCKQCNTLHIIFDDGNCEEIAHYKFLG